MDTMRMDSPMRAIVWGRGGEGVRLALCGKRMKIRN
jgi:hypothetical protein